LKAEHGVAVRANRGLLAATDRGSADGDTLDAGAAAAHVEQSHDLQSTLAETGQKHNTKLAEEPEAGELLAATATKSVTDSLRAASGDGNGPGYPDEPLLDRGLLTR
jgi:type VI secretion system secreted protein VgrG